MNPKLFLLCLLLAGAMRSNAQPEIKTPAAELSGVARVSDSAKVQPLSATQFTQPASPPVVLPGNSVDAPAEQPRAQNAPPARQTAPKSEESKSLVLPPSAVSDPSVMNGGSPKHNGPDAYYNPERAAIVLPQETEADAKDSAAALRQARRELQKLKKQLGDAEVANGGGDDIVLESKMSYPGAREKYGKNAGAVADLKARVAAKQAEVKKARETERGRYVSLRSEVIELERQRDSAKALASGAAPQAAADYGGSAEMRGRASEEVSALNIKIKAKRHEISLIMRDNPSFASILAPLVVVRNWIAPPRSAAEKDLRDQIRSLERERNKLRFRAAQFNSVMGQAPSESAMSASADDTRKADAIQVRIDALDAKLKNL